jgi:hypothetical protein
LTKEIKEKPMGDSDLEIHFQRLANYGSKL